nr:unnamed protein product [Spirometra erinaceieuropaei]
MLCGSTNVVKDKPCEARKDVIISGYLMKSPPPAAKKSKSVSPLLCLSLAAHPQQNWKKRFCVLYKLRKPGQTEVYLHYFKDRDCKHFKGSVDLQSCHCVYEETETLNRQNVFGIKTKWMGEDRTYLFSAETPEEMNQWLNRLAAALHMDIAVPGPIIPFTGSSPLAHFPTASRPLFPSPTASNRIQASNRVPQGYDLSTASPWSAHSSSGRSQRPPPLQSIPSHSMQSQSDEYKMDFDFTDSEDYYRLTPNDHAYVNLADQSSDMTNAATGDGYLVAVKVPQDAEESDHLVADAPPESKAPESAGSDNQSRQSVYYNVWDLDTQPSNATKGEKVPSSAVAAPQAESDTQLPSRPLAHSLEKLESGRRVFRRSQVLSEYIQLPQSPGVPSTFGQEVGDPTGVTTKGTPSQEDREMEQQVPLPPDSSAPPLNVFSDSHSDSESILPTRSKPAAEGGSDESNYSDDEDSSEEEEEENKESCKSTSAGNSPPPVPENVVTPSSGLNGGVDIAAVANPIADDDAFSHDHHPPILKETKTNPDAQPTSTSPDSSTPVLHYLDAQNLYFSKQLPQKTKKTPPSVPPKPVHLRKTQPPVKPSATDSRDGSDPEADRIEYKELDPVTTCALDPGFFGALSGGYDPGALTTVSMASFCQPEPSIGRLGKVVARLPLASCWMSAFARTAAPDTDELLASKMLATLPAATACQRPLVPSAFLCPFISGDSFLGSRRIGGEEEEEEEEEDGRSLWRGWAPIS